MTVFDFTVKTNKGEDVSLSQFEGKVLLIINTASKCGFTPQYDALEKLYKEHKDAGFEILAFPSNDFSEQEPGTDDEIKEFCTVKYNVTFPLFKKIPVVGENANDLYKYLIAAEPETSGDSDGLRKLLKSHNIQPNDAPQILWNFEKFIINKKGEIVGRFSSNVNPDDKDFVNLIETELSK